MTENVSEIVPVETKNNKLSAHIKSKWANIYRAMAPRAVRQEIADMRDENAKLKDELTKQTNLAVGANHQIRVRLCAEMQEPYDMTKLSSTIADKLVAATGAYNFVWFEPTERYIVLDGYNVRIDLKTGFVHSGDTLSPMCNKMFTERECEKLYDAMTKRMARQLEIIPEKTK